MTELEILSWNVNGLRAILKKGFVDFMQEKNPDILCLQETRASEEQLPPEIMTSWGYHVYFASGEKKGYSGVAILSKVKPLSVARGFGIPEFDREGRVLIADYGAFVLLNIYFPNGKASPERLAYKMRFYNAFLEYADRLKAQGRKIVVCGDVNTAHKEIDIARPRENSKISGFLPVERAWMDKLIAHGYVDTFRLFNDQPGQYTFWDTVTRARERNVGWRIDYFFVSENLKEQLKAAFIMTEIMGSDHCPIGIRLDA
ncbi:exodeoxyribonuclease III [Methanocella arvoryzae]|uniref:Exodeoxyribonuclease III n=1 Tax=Methanocella arvoryzae (strain DSM 22066 / NBRC 105507 / MRE50) TaxID=351160 RepID=Q0W517_METAR|nr:exodeoxyribonuclease III [Methanocella arvoryzae]CAJ36526.1 exodeoxyribonuclease III [Methanocella arvoryzae MRE50]